MELWLTSLELFDLTGYRQKSLQVRWLQTNGVDHTVRADGFPRVPRAVFMALKAKPERAKPNFQALG